MEEDIHTILQRQQIFCSSLKSYFLRKITKYQNILLKNGVQLSEEGCDDNFDSLPRNQSFEDHIELVIGQKTASPNVFKTFLKIGNRISTLRLFRWIYLVVQRTKAARVLHHLDSVADEEIKSVIDSVGQELSVAFEYQLCLLDGDSDIVKLAQHAGACIVKYLNSKESEYVPENLLQAVLEVKPHSSNNKEILKTRAVSFNSHPVCLRWRLSQVFKQPGLRITLEEMDGGVEENSSSAVRSEELAEDKTENVESCGIGSCIPYSHKTEAAEPSSVDNCEVALDTVDGGEIDINVNCWNVNDEAKPVLMKSDLNRTKTQRQMNEVDMGLEMCVMAVTKGSVETSDFSPKDKELNAEKDSADYCSENIMGDREIDPDISPKGNALLTTEERPLNINSFSSVCATHQVRINAEINDTKLTEADTDDTLPNKKTENNEDSRTNISDETGRRHFDITATSIYLHDLQIVHVEKDIHARQSQASEPEAHCADNTQPRDNLHVSPSDNAKDNSCQADTKMDLTLNATDTTPDLEPADKSYAFYGCFTPYGAKCRPKIYGYRGPLHIWNEKQRKFSLIYNDTVTVSRKQRHDRIKPQLMFHQRYIPKTMCKH